MKIKTYENGSAQLLWDWSDMELPTADFKTLREYFQAERDEELGRWRDPEIPDMVVYPHDDVTITVLDEVDGKRFWWTRGDELDAHQERFPGFDTARAYFAAHPKPEPKPWDTARPDEVWVLTINNYMEEVFRCGERGLYSLKTGNPIGSLLSCSHNKITAGRRIWPEGEDK